ncbi:hypothetical protein [Undibacterium flavidum]|uniref:Uncharacterized protein n=1 Tax=Undibacterium flavidum TaxID=2762297 RepID=A0ABR6YD81_9BURK|nr:hypothetical protein [Undibacterium flavidum]MBC3874487.1 hypothetical protein [Undibacterium flavidum]
MKKGNLPWYYHLLFADVINVRVMNILDQYTQLISTVVLITVTIEM